MRKEILEKSKKNTVKLRYITPADVEIPNIKPSNLTHYPIPLNQTIPKYSTVNDILNPDANPKSELDGFYILDTAGFGFPEDVQYVELADRKLKSIVDEDLTYFTELMYMDVSENLLPMAPFGALPKLRELKITCNHIRNIGELFGFDQLMYLDLSYNQLTSSSIIELSHLPMLKELDLSGNHLSILPPDLSEFFSLEKIILEYNKFDDNGIFYSLATLPRIRSILLAHNYLSLIPQDCVLPQTFRLLELLDVAYNYFSSEDSFQSIIELPRIVTIVLYGNPILGPTGEDPMFIYIEDLVEKAYKIRDASNSSLPDIEFLTEIPKKKLLRKGQPLGRFALYRDFSIVQVDTTISNKSNREWRKQGTQTLFGEAMAQKKLHYSSSSSLVPDFTFLTNSLAAGTYNPNTSFSKGITNSSALYSSALNESDTNAIADDVMKKVASEMGLVNEEDLQFFQSYTNIPVGNTLEELKLRDTDSRGDSRASSSRATSRGQSRSLSIPSYDLHIGQIELPPPKPSYHIPQNLFTTDIAVPPTIEIQPIALRTAMKALQRAINQPLTNYNEVPSKYSGASEIDRSTAASRMRVLPKISNLSLNNSNKNTPIEDDTRTSNKNQKSKLFESGLSIINKSPKNDPKRDRTLQQIDLVLQNLNDNSAKLTSYNENEEFNNGSPSNNSISEESMGAHNSSLHMKKSVHRMQQFAKVNPGVKNLMDMVHTIVKEFND